MQGSHLPRGLSGGDGRRRGGERLRGGLSARLLGGLSSRRLGGLRERRRGLWSRRLGLGERRRGGGLHAHNTSRTHACLELTAVTLWDMREFSGQPLQMQIGTTSSWHEQLGDAQNKWQGKP